MIKSLIGDRENTQNEAIREVSSKWAESQTVAGPFISIPYYKFVKEPAKDDIPERILQIKEYIHILPSQLKISGNIYFFSKFCEIFLKIPRNSSHS